VAVVNEEGSSVWLIQARGRQPNIAPTANLSITFNAQDPAVTLRSFRYNGTSDPARNGFRAEVVASSDGAIRVHGNFEDASMMYRLVVDPAGYDQTNGPATTFETDPNPAVNAGTSYGILVASPDEFTNPGGPAFVVATITWP
jgi:hypothetical protein